MKQYGLNKFLQEDPEYDLVAIVLTSVASQSLGPLDTAAIIAHLVRPRDLLEDHVALDAAGNLQLVLLPFAPVSQKHVEALTLAAENAEISEVDRMLHES